VDVVRWEIRGAVLLIWMTFCLAQQPRQGPEAAAGRSRLAPRARDSPLTTTEPRSLLQT